MEKSIRTSEVSSRRLARACKHVNDLWFPASPELVGEMRRKLSTGIYDSHPDAFYQDVRSDFSLFMYAVRKLARLVREDKGVRATNPAELFSQAGIEQLKALLDFDDPLLTRHSLRESGRQQIMRLEEAMVSASAVESLAVPNGIDPEDGYTTALVRQLGHTLIAFNYSSVYEKCLAELEADESLDEKLSKALGFSPALLALSLFQDWGLAPGFFDHSLDNPTFSMKENATGMTLARLCQVGEALARANNPETYPSASRDWEEAKEVIEKSLGKRGLSTIRRTLQKNTAMLVKSTPSVFKGGLMLSPEAKLWQHWESNHLEMNPFLASCRKEFCKPMHHFYEKVLSETVPHDSVGMLVKEIIPISGFQGGCVFTIDPATRLLVPQLKIRSVRLRLLEAIPYGNTGDPVARAFETFEAIRGADVDDDHKRVAFMAGIIGFSQRIGVLYLEMDEKQFLAGESDYEAHFRALCKAISDALRLR